MSSLRRTLLSLLALSVIVGLLPASSALAARNKPPKMKKAVMKDKDRDGLADRVVLAYNERIKHRVDKRRFPFKVAGYKIKKINAAKRSRRLVIVLRENADAPSKPASIKYSRTRKQPVRDLKRKQAKSQLLSRNIIGLAVAPPPPTEEFTLTVSKSGDGLGTVRDDKSKIDCGQACSAKYPKGTSVTLTATPDAVSNATFAGWTGCTSSTTSCTVTMDADKSVSASFSKEGNFLLTVTKAGGGTGTVTSTSTPTQASQINCGATCSASFPKDAQVTLTAAADEASQSLFAGWDGGGCTGLSTTCNVTMDAAKNVNATFNQAGSFTLSVVKQGTGTVTSTSAPTQASQINCGSTCTATYPAATQVTLTAQPDQATGGTFGGWSGGGCTGASTTCTITMDATKTVTATFAAPVRRQLTVNKSGDGDGTVTSTSTPTQATQVDCGATCQATYPDNASVTLTATADAQSDFAGWSGDGCTGSSPTCNVTMNAAKTVTATFDPKETGETTYTLTVTATNGTVACAPEATGGADGCNGTYPADTPVVITATAGDGMNPLTPVWTGCDAPLALVCNVTMSADKVVTVTFAPLGLPFNVGLGMSQP